MRGTLSQSSPRTARASRSLGANALLVLVGAVAIACNRPDPSTDAASSHEETAPDEAANDFAWPTDPSHPVLGLEIEGSAGLGTIKIELIPELAPVTVAQVIALADQGYYDGTTFHRVIPGFMIQGGDPNSRDRDPTNDGQGRSERALPDEFGEVPFLRGVVGMGNKGRRNSNSTQFFIMQAENRGLTGRYTAIGRVVSGIEFVDQIAAVETDRSGRWGPKDRPIANVVMKRVALDGRVGSQMLDETAEPTVADAGDFETASAGKRSKDAPAAQ
ncbi:MAG: hypothetical protein CL908_22080 [Deltaproteobacteria bacterium]|nr:hypothetical protein [Deltaproteobacteria bacterium]